MTLNYTPKNNPRVIIIQKLYGKYYNDDEISDQSSSSLLGILIANMPCNWIVDGPKAIYTNGQRGKARQ